MNTEEPSSVQDTPEQDTQQQDTPEVKHEEITLAIEEEHKKILEHAPTSEVRITTPTFTKFIEELKALHDPEKKLEVVIHFMEEAIAQTGVPHFKEFWEARRICLDLFKENINPTLRMTFWARYSELCRQARKLKEIFDEQSAFAAEQIEMAVSAIEAEVVKLADLMATVSDVDFGIDCRSIQGHKARYNEIQRELNLLNAYAGKTNALRKELIKTEMRIRAKNKFFERLSKLGDSIFPRRKELIQEVSKQFLHDVEHFISTTFANELKTQELFDARDEIKALQSVAKVLTLNTEVFSETRKRLSECWDIIKDVVKERRKSVSEQKAAFKKNCELFSQEIDELQKGFLAGEIASQNCYTQLDDIGHRMRKAELGKPEIHYLREKTKELRNHLSAKMDVEDQQRKQEVKKREDEKLARFAAKKDLFKTLIDQADSVNVQELTKEIAAESFTRSQKQELDSLLRKLKDAIEEKKEAALLQTDGIGELRELLKERKERRREIKDELETLRKAKGGSGLDFAQAMEYDELLETQKMRLEKIEAGIREVEEKIGKRRS
jgi:hypothetical protein